MVLLLVGVAVVNTRGRPEFLVFEFSEFDIRHLIFCSDRRRHFHFGSERLLCCRATAVFCSTTVPPFVYCVLGVRHRRSPSTKPRVIIVRPSSEPVVVRPPSSETVTAYHHPFTVVDNHARGSSSLPIAIHAAAEDHHHCRHAVESHERFATWCLGWRDRSPLTFKHFSVLSPSPLRSSLSAIRAWR